MRPGRLTVRAFGPYAHEQVVDFDALRADGLFLIHGATGSGKTFLLDGLSFALYGEVSGGRSAAALRSDHADPAAEPTVALDFHAQGERWLVERVPPHQRLGLRAGTVVDKPARAALSRWVQGSWSPEATGVREVGLRIGELVGLTAKQFRQVILLPQGRFEEVLLATSDTREELLKTLFDSVLFESVSLHLDRRARDAADALGGTERDLVHLRRQATERWAEVTGRPGNGSEPVEVEGEVEVADGTDLGAEAQQGLDQLAVRAADRSNEAAALAAVAEQAAADAATAEAAARAVDERHRLRRQLLATRACHHEQAPAIDEHRARLAAAARASAIAPALDRLIEAEQALADADRDLHRATAHLTTTIEGARGPLPDEVRSAAVATEPGLGPREATAVARTIEAAHDALTVRAATLAGLVDVAERRVALVERAAAARRRGGELAHGVERARFELAGLGATEVHLRDELRAADAAAAQLDGVEASAQALTARARAAVLLGDAEAELERRRHAHARTDHERRRAHEHAAATRAAHLDGIAAVLAEHLTDGDACLVCGATEHPHPASSAPDAVDADDVATAEQRLEVASAAERSASAAVAQADADLAALRRDAGPAAADPERAMRHAEAAIALVSSTATIAATGGDLLDQLDALAARRDALAEQIDTDAPLAATARRDATNLLAQADHDADQLRQAIGDIALPAARAEVAEQLAAVGAVREAGRRAERARAGRDRADDDFRRDLAASPFADRTELGRATVDAPMQAALAQQVADHDRQVAAVEAQLALPELRALPLDAPVLEHLAERRADARAAAQVAHDHRARWAAAADAIAGIAERHRALEATWGVERDRTEVLVRVADQCMGRVGDKVSLQRWVLATYLEEICELATVRLQTMSSHRYSLRVHRERAARGARSGLDLRVFDAHTGEERSVQSLSGGETFQASLALALAVADSVQQHAGGVHLDALFIDEGFGSLDPHSLELAIDELDQLRAGGRTVGVISHVAALRERIRVGIEVTATPTGSTIRVGDVAAA